LAGPDQVNKSRGLPLTLTLPGAVGFLLIAAVLTVLGIGLWGARKNTFELLGNQARITIASSIGHIRQHLSPATD
jgi:hypothetical protein